MLKKLSFTCILFFLLSNVLYAQSNEDQLIDEMVSQVDTEELRLIVEQLSGAQPLDDGSNIATRRVGTEGNEKGAAFIEEQYSNIGTLDIMQDSFNALRTARLWALLTKLIVLPTLPPEKGEELLATIQETLDFIRNNNIRRCENMLATLRGETSQFVFTTAHYDSIVGTLDEIAEDALAPGADDNATGVAATIMAARILSQYSFTNSICFMNPDLEELSYYGTSGYLLQHIFGLKRIRNSACGDPKSTRLGP